MVNDDKLKVCAKCGWYDGQYHKAYGDCRPEAGALADRLAAAVPDVPSTKLGYGHGRLVFQFSEWVTLRMRVAGSNPNECLEEADHGDRKHFWIEDLWAPGSYPEEDVAELVRAIAGTRIGRGGK